MACRFDHQCFMLFRCCARSARALLIRFAWWGAPRQGVATPASGRSVELWFKDEDPVGLKHDYVTLINKGDRQTNAESPYTITLGEGQIQVGERVKWVDQSLNSSSPEQPIQPNGITLPFLSRPAIGY